MIAKGTFVAEETKLPLRFMMVPAVFGAICVCYLAFDFYLTTTEQRLRSEWETKFEPERRRYADNQMAEKLAISTKQIGIELRGVSAGDHSVNVVYQSARLKQVWPELNHYVRAEALSSGVPSPVPEQTLQFVIGAKESIERIQTDLIHGETAEWQDPYPSEYFLSWLKGMVRLHHLLAAVGLYRLEQGDTSGAERALSSCWRLSESLVNRSESICVMVAMRFSSIQMGILRKLPSIPSVWNTRFHSLQYRRALSASLAAETRRFYDGLASAETRHQFLIKDLSNFPLWSRHAVATVMDPYLRLSRLEYLSLQMNSIRSLQTAQITGQIRYPSKTLLSGYLHEYESINASLLEFESKKEKWFER